MNKVCEPKLHIVGKREYCIHVNLIFLKLLYPKILKTERNIFEPHAQSTSVLEKLLGCL